MHPTNHRARGLRPASMALLLFCIAFCSINFAHSMGTHILHAGPSCTIQPARSGQQHHHHVNQKHHRGICYSALLCKQKGGVSVGKCGLGNACCIFPQSCSSISVRNSTYFTNADYPAATPANGSSVGDCALTIHRMPGIHPICQLR